MFENFKISKSSMSRADATPSLPPTDNVISADPQQSSASPLNHYRVQGRRARGYESAGSFFFPPFFFSGMDI